MTNSNGLALAKENHPSPRSRGFIALPVEVRLALSCRSISAMQLDRKADFFALLFHALRLIPSLSSLVPAPNLWLSPRSYHEHPRKAQRSLRLESRMSSIQECSTNMSLEASQPARSRPSSSSHHSYQRQSTSSDFSHFIILDLADWKRRSAAFGFHPRTGCAF